MSAIMIVAVLYEEPEYEVTRKAIADCDVPTVWVDRRGVGSLARALNEGFQKVIAGGPEYVWFVTNIGFGPELLPRLFAQLSARPNMAALQPAYDSDHRALQPNTNGQVLEVPFVEFTCPLVRAEVYHLFPLDERMPYWGHDLDWGHRVRAAGWTLGVDQGAPPVEHTYIRNVANPSLVTRRRAALRQGTNASTGAALRARYGPTWKSLLGWV